MKRTVLIIIVASVHVLILGWLIRGCQPAPPTRDERATEDKARRDGGDLADVAGADATTDGSGGTDRAASRRNDIYQPKTLRHTEVALPPTLRQATIECRAGVLVDFTSNRILWAKDETKTVPIASMTKMMTVLLLMESIAADSELTLDTLIPVTRSAASIGGRQVYLDPREKLTLDELLKCTIIRSANDTAYLIAEYLSKGNVQDFIKRMNRRADELGFPTATFSSPHGLPLNGATPDKASPLELAFLARILLSHPEVVRWSSTRLEYIRENTSKFKPFQLINTNTLVEKVPGVTGMKTGFTQDAGYCMTVTCTRSDRTLVLVVTGCRSNESRDDLATKLLEWGFAQ